MSTKERIGSSRANKSREPVTSEGRTRAPDLRRTLKFLDAPPQNQKFHHEPRDAQPPHSEDDTDGAEAPPIPSTINNRHETRLSADLRRILKLPDAPLQNQKFHHEPSPAQPPRSYEDRDGAEAPSSTIDHLGPSTIPPPRYARRKTPGAGKSRPRVCFELHEIGPPDARSIWPQVLVTPCRTRGAREQNPAARELAPELLGT